LYVGLFKPTRPLAGDFEKTLQPISIWLRGKPGGTDL